MSIKTPEGTKKAVLCTVSGCKKLAWEEVGLDNKKYYFCPKHGAVQKVD